ncbi:Two-component system response regulator [[Clostridium] ultunense Esp]|uniref:Two-component system response regulator n=1 Tax=[Clostridium] ultunense Esp TaxID=1288971 RepID=M1ZCL5_9FIRM|nr:response regulator transcription factor [Schnuerera ultunensis]CCQ96231.1 Two-component system response regulator [[Clostridium] ultunense Esp]SHD78160.1 Two-component system response regulator [[Clostridium] ultunense Esp]
MKKILLVEDDLLLNQTLAFHLTTEGYEVISSYNAASSKDYLSKGKFDLIILDINLPDGSGFDLCKIWRGKTTTPIIFLTAKDMESDMLKGYELGAEDYITKPFHVSVFLKKVEVLLRKTSTKNIEHIYDDGNLFLNFTKRTAMLQGKNIELTTGEFNLLYLFVVNYKMVLTRNLLLEKLWDGNEKYVDQNALTMMISRIRSKIETKDKKYIKTIYGMGYQWVGDAYDE